MLPIIQVANGLQHVYLRRSAKGGTFHTWTGDAETPFEDAKFGFEMFWYGSPTTMMDMHLSSPGVFEIHLSSIGKLGIDKFIGSVIACAFPFSTICLYEWYKAIRNDITLYIQCRIV